MTEDKGKKPPQQPADNELEREAHLELKFSLADAIGRLAGSDLLKGASPVPRKRQAEHEVDYYLDRHLVDTNGALEAVLLRRFRESEIFLKSDYREPLTTLALVIDQLLESEPRLQDFVHEVDREWGRMHLERPHFQQPDSPAHPDDPYTFTSVRDTLTRLVKRIRKS